MFVGISFFQNNFLCQLINRL